MGRYSKTGLFKGTRGASQMSLENHETDIKIKDLENHLLKNSSLSKTNNAPPYNKDKSNDVGKVESVNIFKLDEHGSAPTKWEPNSVTKVYRNGKLEQERYYDENGDVYLDIDYSNHGNPKKHPEVPHQHHWKRDKKGNLIREPWEKINKWQKHK